MKNNVYQIITDRILEQLSKGVIPWRKPWTGGHDGAYSYTTGKAYSVLNQMLLAHADAYLTFNQIKSLGGKVKKGAKSEIVTFWKMLPVEDTNKEGEKVTKVIPFLRYYPVFWIGDTEGIDRKDIKPVTHDPIEEAENIVNKYMTSANHPTLENTATSDKAYYSPISDKVVVPTMEQFQEIAEYYSTLFHELTHSTGHTSRLNRLTATAHFGNEEYSKEELVAEIGAATLVNMAGIETKDSFNNSAAYIQGWSKALKDNVKMIVEASSKAAKAVDYILGDDNKENDDNTTDGANKAPEVETKETKKATKKTDTQKAHDKLMKEAEKLDSYTGGRIKSGMFEGKAYVVTDHQAMITSDATSEKEIVKFDAAKIGQIVNGLSENADKSGTINLTAKEIREGIRTAKNGKRTAKVMYTTSDGITLNANYLLNAIIATGANSYRYLGKQGKKSPVLFENDNTKYLVLPIYMKNMPEMPEGFKAID